MIGRSISFNTIFFIICDNVCKYVVKQCSHNENTIAAILSNGIALNSIFVCKRFNADAIFAIIVNGMRHRGASSGGR